LGIKEDARGIASEKLRLEPRDRVGSVLFWLGRFVDEVAESPRQGAILRKALTGLERHFREADDRTGFVAPIDVALAVYAAVAGTADPAIPLASACACVFLAADIFDDLADGDRQPQWEGENPAIMNLAAATILSALPQLVIARLDLDPARRARMAGRLSLGLLRMSAGQHEDLAATGSAGITVGEVEAAVAGKAGEQVATYAALAAEMAGTDGDLVAQWAELGREIGMAGQLMSDCHDLLADPECRDLAHGSRTLPIVAHVERLHGAERTAFLALLDRARGDIAARQEVRERLIAAGEVRRVMFGVQLRFAHARGLAERLGAKEPGRSALVAGIASLSGVRPSATLSELLAAAPGAERQ
jgi:geranylgeranyl pyrophosphate synthase